MNVASISDFAAEDVPEILSLLRNSN